MSSIINMKNSQEGFFLDLTGDASSSIQIAMFDIENEKHKKKEDFISSFKVAKVFISKYGTNIRYFLNSKLNPLNEANFESNTVLKSNKYHTSDYWIFIHEFSHIIWVTYRENFRSVSSTKLLNSDVGWGCTIRVGQMLLMSLLKKHLPNPDYDLILKIQENLESAPYSLHKITELGLEYEKKPGDWYSPSTMGYILTLLLENSPVPKLKCFISMNCALYRDEILSLAYNCSADSIKSVCKCIPNEYEDLGVVCGGCGKRIDIAKWENAIFIQVPIMLGMRGILPEYIDTLKSILDQPSCVGIIGGKPRMALFIVGYTSDSLIVLDPHLVQPAARSEMEFKHLLSSYYCRSPMLIPFNQIEGSFNVGFYIENEKMWNGLERFLERDSRLKGIITIRDKEFSGDSEIMEILHSGVYFR